MTSNKAFSPEPIVTLVNYFKDPFDNAVATARTCYSSKVVWPEDVRRDEAARQKRDHIAESIYWAGHHTTLQHATFQFALERVSRQCIWSFLHSHPFYNSEQVSQRYVEVAPGHFSIPPLEGRAREIFEKTLQLQMEAYQRLLGELSPALMQQYKKVFPNRDPELKQWKSSLKKRAQEAARYVLPVATHAHLYHTVSGLTLHRYHRLCEAFDAPIEQRLVVEQMIRAVDAVDPLFFKKIEDVLPLDQTPEFRFFQGRPVSGVEAKTFVDEFDASLGTKTSKLVDYSVNAEGSLAAAVRAVLGLPSQALSDREAIASVLDPSKNRQLGEALNLMAHGKLTRTLSHVHFTFRKKISHTADSQDQRHRMTPGSRPVLFGHFVANRPDYILPAIFKESSAALETYTKTMEAVWKAITDLLNAGAGHEAAAYLLPNAFPVRFHESGDLLNHHHKWTKRLCFNAQEEIWHMCRDEVAQVSDLFPEIGRFISAPCGLRAAAGLKPICPEGDRFCGVPVWRLPRESLERII